MPEIFSTRLKEARGAEPQSAVCKAIGVKQGTYSTWELGKYEPPLAKLVDIAKYFGVSSEWLLGIETVGDRIRKTREALGWTLPDLIDKFNKRTGPGLGESYLAGYETGKYKPEVAHLRVLASIMCVTYEFLIGEKPMPRMREVPLHSTTLEPTAPAAGGACAQCATLIQTNAALVRINEHLSEALRVKGGGLATDAPTAASSATSSPTHRPRKAV